MSQQEPDEQQLRNEARLALLERIKELAPGAPDSSVLRLAMAYGYTTGQIRTPIPERS